MTGFFSIINTWAVFLLPILTMRMFSEDRKQKTDQLLLTAPISILEMVLGKYFAAVAAFMVGVAVTFLYPITISFFGVLPVAETISCYVGFILLCMCVISIGSFMSSLTESQIVAAISTYGVLIIMMFLGNIASSISNEVIVKILLWLSPMQRFSEFTMGILNLESVVYYISVTALFLFLTVTVFEKRRLK
jgi:ABC-2 type transport system permease protein